MGSPNSRLLSLELGMAQTSTTGAEDCPHFTGFPGTMSVFHGNIMPFSVYFGKSGLLTSADTPVDLPVTSPCTLVTSRTPPVRFIS